MSKREKIKCLKSWIANRSESERTRLTQMYVKQVHTDSHNLSVEISKKARADAQKKYNAAKQSKIQLEINKGLNQ